MRNIRTKCYYNIVPKRTFLGQAVCVVMNVVENATSESRTFPWLPRNSPLYHSIVLHHSPWEYPRVSVQVPNGSWNLPFKTSRFVEFWQRVFRWYAKILSFTSNVRVVYPLTPAGSCKKVAVVASLAWPENLRKSLVYSRHEGKCLFVEL